MTHPELLETIDWLAAVRKDAAAGSWKPAARRLGRAIPGHEEFAKEEQAKEFVRRYFFELLEADRYLEATAIAWSPQMFEQRPLHIKRIFDCLTNYDKVILCGGSSLSKSYSAAAFFTLDTVRDPNDTAVKFGSINDTNLRGNLWSNLVQFHEHCLFPVELSKIDSRMRLRPMNARPDCGIDAVMFAKTTEAQGKIKGFHPKPFRPDKHPKFGNLTRVRILLDECLPYKIPVQLADGTSKPIGEIVEKKLPLEVLSYDTVTGQQKRSRIVAWQKIPNRKPLVKIETRLAWNAPVSCLRNFVVCTVDHKIWTENRGWVLAGEIVSGDVLQVETGAEKTQAYKMTGAGRAVLGGLRATKDRKPSSAGRITKRGGNGHGPTLAETALHEALGDNFELNYTVPVGRRSVGYPTHYKIDIANPECRIAVEVDGGSHNTIERKKQDAKKEAWLKERGWRIFRFTNRQAWQNPTGCADKVKAVPACPHPATVFKVSPVSIRDNYVYDITVADTACFYANGILVHNCQNLPDGVEKDFGSPLSTVDETTHLIKIVLTLNPEDESRWALKLAEPTSGWDEKKMDELLDYTSAKGWRVCRLDGAFFENVVQRRVVFPGFMTYEGFRGYIKAGSELSKDYWIFGRGWPPPGRAQEVVIPSAWFESSLGEPLFTGNVVGIAGADIAFEGDHAILGLGRYGMATGWMDDKGIEHRFDSRKVSGEVESRHCLVVDQLIEIMSRDSVGIGQEIKSWCQKLQIDPGMVCLDKSGNGIGVSSYLARFWSDQIIAINWKEGPTKNKILAEDKEAADVQTANKIGEMHFTMRRWIQPTVRGFFINPLMQRRDALKSQCTTRHFRWAAGNRFEVESKDDFKKHAGYSPDENDAVIMMTMVPRVRMLQLPAMMDELVLDRPPPPPPENQAHDPGDVTPELASDTHWVNPELELTGVRFHDEEG